MSIDPTVAPRHGSPLVSAPLAFGNQVVATTSATRPILVAAVLGPAGTFATLTSINLSGADASEFSIVGNTCITGVPSLLHNGLAQAALADACTISVAFSPATLGAKSAQIAVQSAVITRTIPLTGTGVGAAPVAAPVALTVARNRSASVDLAPFISGANLLGVRILTPPSNGTAALNGTVLTYTPAPDFIGPDSLTYESFSATQSSGPATISVNVVSRTNPADDPEVVGLVSAQTKTVRRFSRAQISNIQHRMRGLHQRAGAGAAGGSAGYAASSGDSVADDGSGQDGDPVMLALAGPLTSLFSTGSLNLASTAGGLLPEIGDGLGLWIGGNIRFGTHDRTPNSDRLRFTTDGITAGIDRRFRDDLVLGLGAGYSRDDTDVGFNGTNSEATALSIAAYGSYHPISNVYLDALAGYSAISLESQRFVPSTGSFSVADRDGDQWFASLAAGYEFRKKGTLLSPYARIDYAHDSLEETTETGAGTESLTYLEQDFSTFQVAVGLRAESAHPTRFGWVEPRAFIEYRHDFEGERPATVLYADEPGGPAFSVAPSAISRDALHVGIGNDFVFRRGTRLGIDYEFELLSSLDSSQAIRFWLSHSLDGKLETRPPIDSDLFRNPVRVEAGYTWDDNLNRTREPDKLYDHIYSLNVSQGAEFPITSHSRFLARWFADAVKLHTYSGLDRFSGGVQGKLQYRPSGSFSAPTYGLFARAVFDEYDSGPRDGYRYSFGIEFSKPLTDRIHLFAALARNARNANAAVFDGEEYSGRMRVGYSLRRWGSVYLSGEYREGDAVSSASAALTSNSMPDSVYDGRIRFASRYEARTALLTLGYSLPLGRRDSIDFSWTRAHSEPTGGQAFLASGPYGSGGSRSYTADQYSIFYLMQF
ncbi:MAG: autotransporter domain-containing protein [Gammaproteobacteria bacterium]|nr:autotransporter domain-containing protein [Gammaproteobacteria bacterium]